MEYFGSKVYDGDTLTTFSMFDVCCLFDDWKLNIKFNKKSSNPNKCFSNAASVTDIIQLNMKKLFLYAEIDKAMNHLYQLDGT